jgi:hypothetical protein
MSKIGRAIGIPTVHRAHSCVSAPHQLEVPTIVFSDSLARLRTGLLPAPSQSIKDESTAAAESTGAIPAGTPLI